MRFSGIYSIRMVLSHDPFQNIYIAQIRESENVGLGGEVLYNQWNIRGE